MLPHDPDQIPDEAWFAACYRLTHRVERISASKALLDLGRCSPEEALVVIQHLLASFAERAYVARVGLAPSGTLAQLAMLQSSAARPIWLVTPAEVPAFLRPLPVDVLTELHPPGIVTTEMLHQLQQYGLRTLWQLASLGTAALRRHFGAKAGGFLAAVAAGHDPSPLRPTPPPATLSLRVRLPDGSLPPDTIPSLLPIVAAQAVTLLHQGRLQTQDLCLSVRWDSSRRQEASVSLREPAHDFSALLRALRQLYEQLLDAHQAHAPVHPEQDIASLRLTLGQLHVQGMVQESFWQTRAQRVTAAAQVAEALTVRYGQAMVIRPQLAVPAAIFHEERYRLATADTVDEDASARPETSSSEPSSHKRLWQDVPHRLHWW
jgi:nucleotidyltransferase/DNA polymerase involved in DNA repair